MSATSQWQFNYSLPPQPSGPLLELSFPELEVVLQNNLAAARHNPKPALWELAKFYSHTKRHEPALDCLRKVLALEPDLDAKAGCILAMGQTMEQVGDFAAAVRYYWEAFAFEPTNTWTWYFINNNLGYSLNQLGNYAEGERFCRAAIGINPNRPNGYKNLGLALQGQGRFAEAARCFVQATQADAGDARSLKHLEELLTQHPELGFTTELACCRHAVNLAAAQRNAAVKPVIQRGWRKQWFLVRHRMSAWLRRG